MPTYEYYCDACGGTFEMIRPMAESEFNSVCPCCAGTAKRVLSQVQAPIIKDPRLPTAKAERVSHYPGTSTPPAEVYSMDFGRTQRDKLDSLAQVRE